MNTCHTTEPNIWPPLAMHSLSGILLHVGKSLCSLYSIIHFYTQNIAWPAPTFLRKLFTAHNISLLLSFGSCFTSSKPIFIYPIELHTHTVCLARRSHRIFTSKMKKKIFCSLLKFFFLCLNNIYYGC